MKFFLKDQVLPASPNVKLLALHQEFFEAGVGDGEGSQQGWTEDMVCLTAALANNMEVVRKVSDVVAGDSVWGSLPDGFMSAAPVDAVAVEGVKSRFAGVGGDVFFGYRMFMVDGRVVTGAGKVESNTPLVNESVFDPKMRRSEAAEDYVVASLEHLRKFVEVGREVGAALAEAGVRTVAFDLGVDSEGSVVLTDVVDLRGARLFAADVQLLGRAVATHPGEFRVVAADA